MKNVLGWLAFIALFIALQLGIVLYNHFDIIASKGLKNWAVELYKEFITQEKP